MLLLLLLHLILLLLLLMLLLLLLLRCLSDKRDWQEHAAVTAISVQLQTHPAASAARDECAYTGQRILLRDHVIVYAAHAVAQEDHACRDRVERAQRHCGSVSVTHHFAPQGPLLAASLQPISHL